MQKEVLKRLGKKIQKARKELGYKNRKEFAKAFDIPEAQIKKYETGKETPPLRFLIKLCNNLEVPVRAFIYGKTPRLVFRTCKKNKTALTHIKDETLINSIIDNLQTLKELKNLAIQNFEDFPRNKDSETTAKNFIEFCHLTQENFNTWDKIVDILAEKNIYVFVLPLKSKISAVLHKDDPFFIVLNSNEPKDRWSFSLLHEIGHLVAPEDVKKDLNEEENFADKFAKDVLIPKKMRLPLWEKFKNLILSWNEKDYEEFFNKVRKLNPLVSPEAVFYTLLQEFGNIEIDVKKLGRFKKVAKNLREKDVISLKPEEKIYLPKPYIEEVKKLYEEGKISFNRQKELLFNLEK